MTPDLGRRLLDALPWAALAVRPDLVIAEANTAAAHALGAAEARTLRGRSLGALCRIEPHGWLEGTVGEVARGGRSPRPVVLRAFRGDETGDALVVRVHVLPLAAGDVSLAAVVLEDLPPVHEEDRADVLIEQFFRIASHVRHEINNPLMGVLGHGEILESRADLPEDVRARVRAILDEARRIRDHVRELGAIRREPRD